MSQPPPWPSSRSSTTTHWEPFYPTYIVPPYFTATSDSQYPTYIESPPPYNYPNNSRSALLALMISGFVCLFLSVVVCVVGCVYHSKQKRRQGAAEAVIPPTLVQMTEAGAGQPSMILPPSTHQPQYKLQSQPQISTNGPQVYSIYIPPGYISPPAGDELVLVPKKLFPLDASFPQSGATTYVLPQPQPAQSPLQQPRQPLTPMQKQKQSQASTEMGIEVIREESGAHLGNAASASAPSSSSSRPPDSLIQSQQSGRQSPGAGVSSCASASVHEKQVADLAIQPATDVAIEADPSPKTEV